MKKIAFYGLQMEDIHIPLLQKVIERVGEEGYEIIWYKSFYEIVRQQTTLPESNNLFMSSEDLPKDVSFLFSFGGDGTLLDSVKKVANSGIPILGFNFGRLGFLSVVNHDNISVVLSELFSGHYELEKRTLLKIEDEEGKFENLNYGLNEICFSRKKPYSLLTIKVISNGLFLNKYWGDGLIIATPTGSTGYSLSSGGPILAPDVNSFVLSPIASHNLTVCPIVISNDSILKVFVECRGEEFCVNVDSLHKYYKSGSYFTVRRNDFEINLVRPDCVNFYNTIRDKLSWGIDARN
ncbi:MAG: NAD kinase [Bacteroidales bacterium]|nr:NAD kinase [Bacteroidales bacterium]